MFLINYLNNLCIAEKYFVKLSCMVRIYKLPDFVSGSGFSSGRVSDNHRLFCFDSD